MTIILVIFGLFGGLFITTVSAHTLESTGSIGAVLHVDPEDDPIVGEQTGFYFEFKDTKNKFKPENCNCTFYIEQGGKEIFAQPLFLANENPSLNEASIYFTFPEKNIYQIKITGSPKNPGEFDNFNLEYDLRVSREGEQSKKSVSSDSFKIEEWVTAYRIHLIGGFIIFVFLISVLIKQSRDKKS